MGHATPARIMLNESAGTALEGERKTVTALFASR
jgi:hypothetical protein